MTSYNASAFIKNAIDSIKNQTYKNWELVIVDDCSSDHTLKIINQNKNKKIKIFSLEKHIGRTKALNYGLKKIKSKFIAILDADDIADKNRIMLQKKFLIKNKKTLIVGTWYKIIDYSGKIIDKIKISKKQNLIKEKMTYQNIFCHSSIMFRSELLKKIGFYPSKIIYAQDYAFLLKSMKLHVPEILPKYLTLSRRIPNSMTFNPVYKKIIVLEKIKLLIFSIKNFKLTLKAKIIWSFKLIKAVYDFVIIVLFQSKN